MTPMERIRAAAAATAWPTIEEYAHAHRCPTCGAEPGADCTAPRKPVGTSHTARQSAGIRHYKLDVAAAPWPEDRDPTIQYHTVDVVTVR